MILSVRKLLFLAIPLVLVLLTGITSFLFFTNQSPQEAHAQTSQLAFPSAEGFGRNATGGRGGFVCHVNTTSEASTGSQISGTIHHQGSFRYCIGLSGPRTIVFDVAGTINLANTIVTATNGNFTLAGQTAPGDGVQITRGDFNASGDHAIIRHMRFRPGFGATEVGTNESVAFWGQHQICDHCSLQWALDENTEIYTASNVTIQWSIIAEGLSSASAGYGSLTSSGSTNVSVHHNLYAHNKDRNPRFTAGGNSQIINNVIYNYGAVTTVWPNTSVINANIIGNYYKYGPNSNLTTPPVILAGGTSFTPSSGAYVLDNVSPGNSNFRPTGTEPELRIASIINSPPFPTVGTPYSYPAISTTSSFTAYNDVLNSAGASVPRDPVDARIIQDVQNRTGAIISNESVVGGFPTLTGTPRNSSYDTDYDGMPNTWEQNCGLNPSDPLDGAQFAPNGYTNLENFLNKLAGDTIPQGDCGGLGGGSPTLTPTSTLSPGDITTGLIAHYPFDETSGTTATDTASAEGAQSGTITGGVTLGAPGKIGTGYAFTGTDGLVHMGNPANLNFGANQQFSMSAWIRTSGTGPHMLVSKRGGVGYQFRHTSLGWFLRIDEGSNVETFTSANLSDGAWHHVVFGRDGGKHFIYVDGVLSASTTDSTLADLTDPASFVIGNSATGNLDPWLGTIDDVRVYNRALSSQDIQALFAVGNATPTPTSSPTACHSLDNTQPVPSGYAASYNPFTVQQELLLQAECNSTNITVTLGNGNTGSPTSWDGRVWVFTQGYQLLNNTWQPVTYTCTGEQVPISGGAWCSGEATGTLDSQSTAYLGYTCQWHGATSSYKCGCTDASCTTPLWQAQQIQ